VPAWQTLGSLPTTTSEGILQYVQVRGQPYLYLTSGYRGSQFTPSYSRSLFRYNIQTSSWEKLALPGLPPMQLNAATVDPRGDLYFTGGYNPQLDTVSHTLYVYHPATNTLHTITIPSEYPVGFANSILADQSGHMYVTEGLLTPNAPWSLAVQGWYRYDLSSGQWTNLTSLPVEAAYSHLVFDGHGHILLLGGTSDSAQQKPLDRVYQYNASQNTWTTLPGALPTPLSSSAACADGQGHLVVIGGMDTASTPARKTAWSYDLTAHTWKSLPAMPYGGSLAGAAACDGSGHTYLARGASAPSTPTADFWKLNLGQ
jgi:N-acetylneuraminic acid mutarotase